MSSPEQVNAAINRALDLAVEPDPQKNIFAQFWSTKGKANKLTAINQPVHLFPEFASSDPSVRFRSQFQQALKQNKIVRLPNGDCPHPPEESTASASVSEHSYNATICFSIGNLRRIPPFSLLQEVTALVLHEVTHMGGAEEPEAKAWQDEFLHYFGERFGNVLTDTITGRTTLLISKAYALLGRAQSFAQDNISDRHILPDVMAAVETIASLPDSTDELALALKINPPHPELIGRYIAAVKNMVSTLRLKLENRPGLVLESYRGETVSNLPIKGQDFDVMSLLSEASRDLNEVNESFLAFTQENYPRINDDISPTLFFLKPPATSLDR